MAETPHPSTPLAEEVNRLAVGEKEATPQNNDSNKIIAIPQVWDSCYKGQGTVVAVIDSGLDSQHDVLQLSDVSQAKYQSQGEFEAAKQKAGITHGQWYNNKVIFGYNYVDVNTDLKEADSESHGMHVTGIAAGNPTKKDTGELIYGVAPEAQVMFMRVFSDLKKGTGPALYVKAIEDAVKLGADSINLSLGSANGSLINADNRLTAAIEKARHAGVVVVIAAGNDGTFGSGASQPLALYPDYGLVGSPSTAREAISVASYNNSSLVNRVFTIKGLESDTILNKGLVSYADPKLSEKSFDLNKEYSYVFVNKGEAKDYAGKTLTDKIALIERGDLTFSEKVANAIKHGAAGVIIFNNKAGEANISMGLDETARAIPAIFIQKEFGDALVKQDYKLVFNNMKEKQANPKAGLLSDFSSWGLTADGELKPDLAAPGGSIYASINDNEYDMMSGTSMASPHVAGAAALVKQYLLKTHPNMPKAEIETTIKYLLMSTARAHLNPETKAFTLPRQQGAGIIDVAAAIQTGLYLTGGEDDYGSVTLGNVGNRIQFDVTVHNIGPVAKELTYQTYLNTDQVKDGFVTLAPEQLAVIKGGTIRVEAGQTKTITIDMDVSEFHHRLHELMPNGYFLEGFVQFTDPVDGGEVVSLPYVGFKGTFQNLEVLEKPIYEIVANQEAGFYFAPDATKEIPAEENYTALMTTTANKIYSTGATGSVSLKVLGTYQSSDGKFILKLNKEGKPQLAISPNNDQQQDSLALKGVFLRNFNNLRAKVYRADDKAFNTPLWISDAQFGDKNYYSGKPDNPKSTLLVGTEWQGTTTNGPPLEDGRYKYVLSYYSDVPGATKQEIVFDVILDRQAPTLTTATYDQERRLFQARPAVEHGESGIFREQVFYLIKNQDGHYNEVLRPDGEDRVLVQDNKVFIPQEADGSFLLPADATDLSHVYYVVEDYAGNRVSATLEDLVSIGNDKGLVSVKIFSPELNSNINLEFSYAVKDDKGNVIAKEHHGQDLNTLKLPFGTYTIDLFLYDEERAKLISFPSATVVLSEDDSVKEVVFIVDILTKASYLVDIDKELPKGSSVHLLNQNGADINLPRAKYSRTDYGKFVPTGDYKLSLILPTGYDVFENLDELVVSVLDDEVNVTKLTLINKTALLATLADQSDLILDPVFYNASIDVKTAYLTSLEKAQVLLKDKAKQEVIDQAVATLVKARQALNGKVTDLTALSNEILEEANVIASQSFTNASPLNRETYQNQLVVAKALLQKAKVSQEEVEQALAALLTAKEHVLGHQTDYTALRQMVTKASVLKQTAAKYQMASPSSKEAYDNLLTAAKNLLETQGATQAEVDALLAQIKAAEKALDGQGNLSSQENTHYPQEQLLPEESQEAHLIPCCWAKKTYEKARLLRSVPKGSLSCSTSLKCHSLELWQIATRS
nr:S8 family serine peptidase [Streptococcus dysgalactiae]